MRATLCDYVMEHMDTEFENLGSLTPRQTIQRDYIDGGQLLTNPEKTSEEQNITSIPAYMTAMRHPASSYGVQQSVTPGAHSGNNKTRVFWNFNVPACTQNLNFNEPGVQRAHRIRKQGSLDSQRAL